MANSPGPFVWTALHLPLPTSITGARSALIAIASLAGHPRVVLEATGQSGNVSWRIGCRANIASRVVAAMEAHLAGLRHERQTTTLDGLPRADRAAVVRLPGDRRMPLRHDESESATRGLLAALARARKRESVVIQVVLGPRRRPSHVRQDVDARDRRAVGIKRADHRFDCEVRIAATASDPARTRALIDGVAAALRTLESPGVGIRLKTGSVRAFSSASSPWIWRSTLSVTDLVPFTGWPIGDLPLPGVPPAHPRPLPLSAAIPKAGRSLGVATVAMKERPIALKVEDSLRHLHLIGPTGVGKSTLMGNLALDDIAQGRGVVVIDPKGDLVEDILARIPQHRFEDVVVLDARDHSPVGLNGLVGGDPELAADTILNVFHALHHDSWGPRTHDILHACLLTLARRGDASIAMIPLLLTNPGFRRSVVGRVAKADPMGLGTFWAWYEAISEAERQTATSPLMNKLRPVLLRPGIRGILGQRRPKFDLTDVFTKRRILLVSLSKGAIGPEAAQLLGSLVVSLLWAAALGRAGVPADRRTPVMVHIDEVQDYLRLPGDLGDALAQARGLGVGFTLAHQHLGQLPASIRDAVLANARSRVAFQLSSRDARDLAKTTRGELVAEDFELLPAYHAYASLLVDGSPSPWTSITTRPFSNPVSDPQTVRALSRATYGVPLSDIEADLLALVDPTSGSSEHLGRSRRPGTEASDGGPS